MKSAYISCPISVDQTILDQVIELVTDSHVEARWWPKGKEYKEDYYNEVITQETNAFIVILPNLAWSCAYDKMTSGSRKELGLAIKAKKPLFIAYKSIKDGLGIYAAEVLEISGVKTIQSIHSTRYNFRDSMQAITYIQKEGRVNRNAISNRNQASNLGQGLHAQLTNGINSLNKNKSWIEATEELYRQGFQQSIEKTIFPIKINTNVIPPIDIDKFMKIYEQCGIMYLDNNLKPNIDLIIDNRILLFF